MNCLRGRFWYSSWRLSICACSFIDARASSRRSRPVCCGVVSSAGVGRAASLAATGGDALASASKRCCCASSSATRRLASARSLPSVALVTGSGVFALLSWSVFPPPSRLACARAWAFEGRSRVLVLTRMTSSGWVEENFSTSGNLKCSESNSPCRTRDTPTLQDNRRDCRSMPPHVSCRNADIRAGSRVRVVALAADKDASRSLDGIL